VSPLDTPAGLAEREDSWPGQLDPSALGMEFWLADQEGVGIFAVATIGAALYAVMTVLAAWVLGRSPTG
jgi:hypothetical protein